MKWLISIVMIGLILGLGSLGYIWWQLASAAGIARSVGQDCLENSATQQQCWSDAITSYVSQHPEDTSQLFTGLYQLVRSGELSVDARVFSDPAHQAGMVMLQNGVDLPQAVIWCGSSFQGACIHGVIMEYADTYFPADITIENFKLCDSLSAAQQNCVHGLGHSLITHNASKSLAAALGICAQLPTDSQTACASGVFMEYSTGEIGQGHHSHEPIGTLVLPCKRLQQSSKEHEIISIDPFEFDWSAVCYASAGSYQQYYPNQTSWLGSYLYCDEVKAPAYHSACIDGVYERLLLSVAYDHERAKEVCREELGEAINDRYVQLYCPS